MAGVVLAGGRSSRMGTPKSSLEWHGSTLLRRTVGIMSRATGGPVVVVRASGQALPSLPRETVVVDDPRQGKGPVQGIAAGLAALAALGGDGGVGGVGGQAESAFVSSTDMPFLHPAFIRCVLRALAADGADVALPVARGYQQPLAAAYRVSLAQTAERLVSADRLRPAFLFDECLVTRIDEARLRQDPLLAAFDPELDSVRNVNSPADYRAARSRPAPEVTVGVADPLAKAALARGPLTVRAATVRGAAEAVGLTFGRPAAAVLTTAVLTTAELNGDLVTTDGETPLATGDIVVFSLSAPYPPTCQPTRTADHEGCAPGPCSPGTGRRTLNRRGTSREAVLCRGARHDDAWCGSWSGPTARPARPAGPTCWRPRSRSASGWTARRSP
jgi:molybdopterin-guanine dinucleotide biosynthesis protein A